MSIKDYTVAELKEISMLDIAYEILLDLKEPVDYYTLLKQVADAKGLTEEKTTQRIAHLYTEMSVDGRFVNAGDNRWGLRSWFPFDQTEEELSQENKTRKKKRAEEEKEEGFDEDEEDFDEFEDLEDELDELANEEDEDDDTKDDLGEDFDVEDEDDDK